MTTTYAWFPGCKIAHHLPLYGETALVTLGALGIRLSHPEFNCCGWPVRDESLVASVFSAVRNFAIAVHNGTGGAVSILTPCKCCFGNLRFAMHFMRENKAVARQVNELLAREGLPEAGGDCYGVEVKHLLQVLNEDVGADKLASMVREPLEGMTVACHYGCHALRPHDVTGFDDPLAPTVFERVVGSLGARTVVWDQRLECCGHPLRGRDNNLSEALMRRKLLDAGQAGADVVATACTYCQLQFDRERAQLPGGDELHAAPEALLVTSLIARALGLEI